MRLALIVASALLLSGGCRADRSPAPTATPPVPADSAKLPPVSLPDLSRLEISVQQQIRERYRSLTSMDDAHGIPATDRAVAYGEMGRLLMAAENFDAAEPFYLHAQALAPDDMRWPYYLGHVYMARAQPDKAVASFERARRLRPADVATLVWLGDVHLDQGRPEQAEPLFAQALAAQPRGVAALFGLGRAALAKREYARAVDLLEQVLSADPRASIAHYPLALAYRGLGDSARAEAHLRLQGEVKVGPPDPLMVELRGLLRGAAAEENRGTRALESGDFAKAAAHFRAGVELAPDNPSLRHKLGTALSLGGDRRGALEQFQETVRRSPDFAQGHYSLGVLLAADGRYEEAVRRFAMAVRGDPNYVDARMQLADALRRTGQLERSLDEYRQVLTIDPRVADARYGYAMTLAALRRYPAAREAFSEAAKLHPDQPRFSEALNRLEAAANAR